MAFACPVFFVFLFAAFEFCGVNTIRHTVDNAAYEAARRGIVPGATDADVRSEANYIMSAVGARNVQIDIAPSPIRDETPEITVTVSVPLDGNGWIAPRFFSNSDVIRGRCHMFREEL
jgi:Flp pilus assembly protein TadG